MIVDELNFNRDSLLGIFLDYDSVIVRTKKNYVFPRFVGPPW